MIINTDDFKKDKYLFNLVSHNLVFENSKTFTDNENYVFVIGKMDKEIWVWTSNNIEENKYKEIIEKLNMIIENQDYKFVCKESLYKYLKQNFEYINDEPFIYDNYVCEKLIEPQKTNGYLEKPNINDKKIIASYWKENCEYFGYDISYELCEKFAESWINSDTFYTWKNNDKIVSFIGYDVVDDTAEISHAYTVPNERGKGYIPNLIYEVTKIILEKGLKPVLNTDYSYGSANNAYKKVGFKETELMYSFSTNKHQNKKIY